MTKLTKKEILSLHNGLHEVGNLNGVKFAYAVSRNISKLKPIIDAIREAHKPSEDYLAYEKERASLAKSCANQVDGKPQKKVEMGVEQFVIKDKDAFDKKLKDLQKKHKTVIDAREKQLKEFESLLTDKVKVELHKVNIKHVPENITARQMTSILPIINEDLTN